MKTLESILYEISVRVVALGPIGMRIGTVRCTAIATHAQYDAWFDLWMMSASKRAGIPLSTRGVKPALQRIGHYLVQPVDNS